MTALMHDLCRLLREEKARSGAELAGAIGVPREAAYQALCSLEALGIADMQQHTQGSATRVTWRLIADMREAA